jgi:hypothetical protein
MNATAMVEALRKEGYSVSATEQENGTSLEITCGEESLVVLILSGWNHSTTNIIYGAILKELRSKNCAGLPDEPQGLLG